MPNDFPNSNNQDAAFDSLMTFASDSFKKGAYAEAGSFYNLASKKCPDSWRANFYTACCKIYNCSLSDLPEIIMQFKELCPSLITMLYMETGAGDELLSACEEYMSQWLALNKNVAQRLHDAVPDNPTHDQKMHYQLNAMKGFCYQLDHIDTWLTNPDVTETKDPDFISSMTDIIMQIWDELNQLFINTMCPDIDKLVNKELLNEILENWTGIMNTKSFLSFVHQKDPNYVSEIEKRLKARIQYLDENPPKSGGCYVATAVYGSYDCPQVWTLRRFRDNTLANTWYGCAFIRAYYATSPTLVKWFGKAKWFRAIMGKLLDRMVAGLQARGVESTPYNDKIW